MNQRTTLLSATVLGGLAVVLGAFGAHALKPVLTQQGTLSTWELASRYQFYSTFALMASGVLMTSFPARVIRYGSLCFLIGTVLFSGSLYLLSLYKLSIFGPVTPIGGLFLIAGWILLLVGIAKK